ncbi:helix-turn-helix domain-containing protein [Actinokineospora auranticolor]|uniref:AraC family transcriptional activator FtrA n=1 Tax=Actinokineospora auranticolor TaxID=155976 RepID=A0A2S6GPL7_9PSEU|nr:helix-turn-helix domain-containing protein [Actinokineospora auranticolor]PPK67071.1 AraC family transcriptional activator FtrA [Actinokineospora auranticolor]
MSQESSHRVALLVDDGANPFDAGVAVELFGLRRPELGVPWYDFVVCTDTPSVRMHLGVFTLSSPHRLAAADTADTVIVQNGPDATRPPSPAILAAVRRAAERGARLVSFCAGAFTLAEAGVLDGRRATTHWRWAAEFARRYPRVRLEPDVLFVDDSGTGDRGPVLSAAGSAAALDLGLYLIQRDHGAEIANAVSRRLVFAGRREGTQRQFVERPLPAVVDTSLAPLLAWARDHLDRPLTVADLARRAATSPATLHRRFRAELGTTPLAWLTAERVTVACRLIERGERGLDRVAAASGLGSEANLRAQLRRHTGLTPSAYRERFGALSTKDSPVPVDGHRVR